MSFNSGAIALNPHGLGLPTYDDFHGFRIDAFSGLEGTRRHVAETVRIGREALRKVCGDAETTSSDVAVEREPLHVQILPRNALALEAEATLEHARDLLWVGRLLCLASAAVSISGITWVALHLVG